MIPVEVTQSGLNFEGHAEFAEKGMDIVCAGVSTLYYALISMSGVEAEECGGKQFVKCRGAYKKMALSGLRLLATTYPKNVQIMKSGCD